MAGPLSGPISCEGTHHCVDFPIDEEGANHRGFLECQKNPGHEKFLTVDEFGKKTSSELGLEDEHMPTVWSFIARTGRIVVSHTSTGRPDTYFKSKTPYPCRNIRGSYRRVRYGTGFILAENVKKFAKDTEGISCPCPDCKADTCQAPKKLSYYFNILTASHVIYDTHEAQNAVFELFYDYESESEEDRKEVEYLYGAGTSHRDRESLETDKCFMVCVTHDIRLAERLRKMIKNKLPRVPKGVLVSHPHGVSKRISIGRFLEKKIVLVHNKESIKLKTGVEVRFPSCCDSTVMPDSLNRRMDHQPIIGLVHDGGQDTFRLLCDVTVYHPTGIILEADISKYSPIPIGSQISSEEKMWWCLPSGAEFITDNGKRLTVPHRHDDGLILKMEILIKDELVQDNVDIAFSEARSYIYSIYDMATCPGSSGAFVNFLNSADPNPRMFPADVAIHFGSLAVSNRSGLLKFQRLHAMLDKEGLPYLVLGRVDVTKVGKVHNG